MITQCPHCTTAFNVTPEQLFVRDGRVRCGNCREVFDGLVHLTSLEALQAGVPPMQVDAPALLAPRHEEPAPVVTAVAPAAAPSHGFSPLNWATIPAVPEVPMPPFATDAVVGLQTPAPTPTIATQPVHTEPDLDASADSAIASTSVSGTAPAVTVVTDANEVADEIPVRRRWPWALAASLAALLLAGQALYGFRSEVAAHFPQLKQPLVKLCEVVHCNVPPLQKPSVLAIQASDLLIIDKAKPHLVQLIVTLENQSNVEVGYPAIDLVLNDRFDHAVARRVFVPKDYLRGADAQKTTIAASGTTTLRMNLDISELPADGFRVLLIPAPQT